MDAVMLRILITVLISVMFLPGIMAILGTAGLLKDKSSPKRGRRIMAVLLTAAAFGTVIAGGIFICFHDKNIIDPLAELMRLDGSYRGLLKLTFLSFAGSIGFFVISLEAGDSAAVFGGKSYRRSYIYLICAFFILAGMYESLCSDTKLKITQIQKDADRHDIQPCGPVFDMSGDSGKVSIVVITNEGLLENNISGLSLSDSEDGTDRVSIDDEKLHPSEGYTCVFSEKTSVADEDDGTVYLLDSEGHVLDSEYYEETVRMADKIISAPEFSVPGGFYDSDIRLTMSCEEPDAEIYYTLDGSVPTAESLKYDGSISITKKEKGPSILSGKNITPDYLENKTDISDTQKATVVRAASIDADGNSSETVTQTYFVGLNEYTDKTVVSLVMDPDDLFGDYGIYVTGRQYDEWYEDAFSRTPAGKTVDKTNSPTPDFSQRRVGYEREGNLEIYEQTRQTLDQPVGVKIQGASTRGDVYKRLSIYSRKIYSGSKWFENGIFECGRTHSFVIRHNFDNAFTQQLVKDRDIAVQDSIPVYVFLNGDFWYDTYIQEKYSSEMISEKYGISEDNVQMLKVGYIENLSDEEMQIYNDCIGHYISDADLSDPEVYREFGEKVDIQSYIDFICANIYLANEDYDDGKNYVIFRAAEKENEEFGDGRLKWGLYDMDLLRNSIRFDKGYETTAMIDTFRDVPPLAGEAYVDKPLFSALLKNEDFRKQFGETFIQMAEENFSADNVEKVMEDWGSSETVESYDEGFFINRGKYILTYMDEVLKEADSRDVSK